MTEPATPSASTRPSRYRPSWGLVFPRFLVGLCIGLIAGLPVGFLVGGIVGLVWGVAGGGEGSYYIGLLWALGVCALSGIVGGVWAAVDVVRPSAGATMLERRRMMWISAVACGAIVLLVHPRGPWLSSAPAWIAYSLSVLIGAMLGVAAVWAPWRQATATRNPHA